MTRTATSGASMAVVVVVVGGGVVVVGVAVVVGTDVVVGTSEERDDVQAAAVSVTARMAAPRRWGDLIGWQGTCSMETPTSDLICFTPAAGLRVSLVTMLIVIAGCGRVGSDLAHSLSEDSHDVSVVEEDPARLARLGASFNGRTEIGLPYDVRTLRRAGVEFADAFVAVTNNDNANLMAVQVAKEVFGVPRTIARLDDPARADAYRALDVQYVAGAHLISRVIHEQIIEREFDLHVTFSSGDIEIVEMVIGEQGESLPVSDFEVSGSFRVAAVRRDGRTFIPDDDFVLRERDLVIAAARQGITARVGKFLATDDSERS